MKRGKIYTFGNKEYRRGSKEEKEAFKKERTTMSTAKSQALDNLKRK